MTVVPSEASVLHVALLVVAHQYACQRRRHPSKHRLCGLPCPACKVQVFWMHAEPKAPGSTLAISQAADGATDEATETPAAADEMPPAAAAEPEAETIVEDPDAKAEEPVDAAADAEPEAEAAHKTAAAEEAQLEQPAIAGDQHNTPDEVTAADMEEAEAADEGAAVERDAEMAASEPADEAAGGEDPIVEEETVAAGDAEAAPEQEEEPAPPMEEPMPAADTVKTAHAAAGPVAAAPSAGAEAMDAEDGVELDFEEAEEPVRAVFLIARNMGNRRVAHWSCSYTVYRAHSCQHDI